MLDKKTFTIGILSLSAVVLIAANILVERRANATYESVQDNDYSMLTATCVQGGDAVYVTEKRSGKMAVFVFSPAQKRLVAMDVQPIQSAFAAGVAARKSAR